MEILELDYPSDRPLDGISMVDALQGSNTSRSEPIGFIYRSKVSWVTDRFKLIGDTSLEHMELYDLINDRAEEENLIEEMPKLAEQLKSELRDWLLSVDRSAEGKDY
jgi:arylsulfatase A-like enzyme